MQQNNLFPIILFQMKNNKIRTIKVSIIGQPNVGKSTFVNSLIKQKVAITSKKAQTTVKKEIGVLNSNNHQLIFYDTPGVYSDRHKIEREKFSISMNAISESDLVIIIFCRRSLSSENNTFRLLEKIKSMKKNFIVLLNKIDLLSKEEFVNTVNKLKEFTNSNNFLSISAIKNYGLQEVLKYIIQHCTFYENKMIKNKYNYNNKNFIEEIVREKILRNIHDEIPYNTKVIVDKIYMRKDSSISVNLSISLKKNSYKPILLGQKGKMIKKIGIEARKELEEIFKKKFHVFLYLKLIKKTNFSHRGK